MRSGHRGDCGAHGSEEVALRQGRAASFADAVFASNTSGLSIDALAQALPEAVRERFCGVHFFNPPRYMSLVELIRGRETRRGSWTSWSAF